MNATFNINAPTYAHAILTTSEFLGALETRSLSDDHPAGKGATQTVGPPRSQRSD
jgi:hypothetical protein